MLMRTKLACGFLGVLVLLILVGGVSWYGMDRMGKSSDQATAIENGVTALLLAKVSQLRFIVYGTPEEVTLTEQYMAESGKQFQLAAEIGARSGDDPVERAELERVRRLAANIKDYQGKFADMVRRMEAISQNDTKLFEIGKGMRERFIHMQQITAPAVLTQGDEASFDLYQTVSSARTAFERARAELWRFNATQTQENAEGARQLAATCRTELDKAALLPASPESKADLVELSRIFSEYERLMNETIHQRTDLTQAIASIHKLVIETADLSNSLSKSSQNSLQSTRKTAIIYVLNIVLISFILGGLIAWRLTRSVLGQLGKDPGELAAIARRVADGDFSIQSETKGRGVYGALVDMVKSLIGHMEEAKKESERAKDEAEKAKIAIKEAEEAKLAAERAKREGMLTAAAQLEGIIAVISAASGELAGQIEQAEHGCEEQAARVTETATAMEEMNQTVLEVARNAGSASEVSAKTRKQAEEGAGVVDQSIRSIKAVREQSATVRENMSTLLEHVQAISQIMGVISDIADQTNLLALNAAIEAARAGEAGRGFAVVADEVRKLAEKTVASTTDVGNVINGIQRSARETMHEVDVTVTAVEEVTTLAGKSGAALTGIVHMVDDTADQVRAIATASEEQSASSDEINRSMSQINTIAVETAAIMSQATKAVEALAGQAHTLNKLVEEMKRS